jgi:Fur family ferric uptake transcriptional regulator
MRTDSRTKNLSCGRPAPTEAAVQTSSEQIRACLLRLDEYIKKEKLKKSDARAHIVRLIVQQVRHFTGPELVAEVLRVHPEIGPATVYRNLPILLESGIIQESLTGPEGQKVYELCEDAHHDHIVCIDCDRIFEFHEESIEKTQDRVARGLGFSPVSHKHVIYARCEFLTKAEKKK